MRKSSNRVYKTLVVGVIVLFIGIGIQPAISDVNKKTYKLISKGNTLYVGGVGPDNYTTITSALNDVEHGDTIFVYNDSSPYIERLKIYKSINLIGEDKYSTIIDGNKQFSVIDLNARDVIISGFTIQNSHDKNDGRSSGIGLFSYNITITNNIIRDNRNGIFVERETNNLIKDNLVYNNWQNGIDIDYGSNHIIMNNEIVRSGVYDIYIRASDNNIISNNNIFSENCWASVLVHSSKNSTIINNVVKSISPGEWQEGIYLRKCPSSRIIGNKVSNSGYHGIFLDNIHDIIVQNNSLVDDGFFFSDCYNIDFIYNTVNGRPVVYLENTEDKVVDEDAGQVILNSCSDITVKNQNINNSFYGIILINNSEDCSIINNNLKSNKVGVFLVNSNNNKIENNSFESNYRYGAFLENVKNCLIQNNIFINNTVGLMIDNDKSNRLGNKVEYNNFINNDKQADFVVKDKWFFRPIRWRYNYWDDIGIRLFYIYIIHGKFFKYYSDSQQRVFRSYRFIDWHPAKEPYDIEV